ncbi:unnamed protein product [Bemisia tabaci]|uniref:Uncharacterized protein n=1 Tax=Bemisia tabaci TaxID=7038 RepID=A0A9P0A316_BEMTA|nr:unnamed protein product [Bemisia tabaci]
MWDTEAQFKIFWIRSLTETETNESYRALEKELIPEKFEINVRSIMENDALIVNLPSFLVTKTNIRLGKWPLREKFEYHLVRQCLKVYPYVYSYIKDSYLFPKFNEKLAAFLETGQLGKLVKEKYNLNAPEASPATLIEGEPRPYSLNDLQLPFFSLIIGLFFSALVYIAEMVMQDFENAVIFRQFRRFKLHLLSKKLIRA